MSGNDSGNSPIEEPTVAVLQSATCTVAFVGELNHANEGLMCWIGLQQCPATMPLPNKITWLAELQVGPNQDFYLSVNETGGFQSLVHENHSTCRIGSLSQAGLLSLCECDRDPPKSCRRFTVL